MIKLWSADKGFFFSSLVYVDHFSAFQGVSCFFRHFYIIIVDWRETSFFVCRLLYSVPKYASYEAKFDEILQLRKLDKQTIRKKQEWVEIEMLLLPCEQALTSEASGEKTCEQRAMERTLSYSRLLSLAACSWLFTLSLIGELAVRLV